MLKRERQRFSRRWQVPHGAAALSSMLDVRHDGLAYLVSRRSAATPASRLRSAFRSHFFNALGATLHRLVMSPTTTNSAIPSTSNPRSL